MTTTTSNTNQLTNTPQAADDYYGWTEDQLLASGLLNTNTNFVRLDVMSNDLGGNAKKLWSIDDGNGNTNVADYDLVQSDMQGVWENAALNNLGVTDKITISNGAILLDLSASLAHFGAKDVNGLAAGDHIHDEFVYAIRLANGALSQARVVLDIWGQNDSASISGDSSGNITDHATAPAIGTLAVIDPDHGQSHTQTATHAASDHNLGSYSIDADGHWSYTVNNALVQHLSASETATDNDPGRQRPGLDQRHQQRLARRGCVGRGHRRADGQRCR
jgi:VCBS repeat-containing protein